VGGGIRRGASPSWRSGAGKPVSQGDEDFKSLEPCGIDKPAITNISNHSERLEGVLDRAVFGSGGAIRSAGE
jgi:hypothetical protein